MHRLAIGRRIGRAPAYGGLLMAVGAATWLTVAASQRPSALSPVTLRHGRHDWLLGPLSGLLPHLAHGHVRLQSDLTIALAVMTVGWLVGWAAAPALPLRTVGAVTGAAQVIMVLGPPQPLTDAFNYLLYSRMATEGINPYTNLPDAAPHDALWALANWHHLPSPYGPLFTVAGEPLALLPLPVAYWAWKAVVLAAALGLLALVAWLAVRRGRSPQAAVAAVGLCPVTLAVGLGGLHNDGPAVLAVMGAVACTVLAGDAQRSGGGWNAAAGALAVVAAGLKPSFAVVVPLIVLGAPGRTWALAGAAWAAAATVAIGVLAFGGALPAVGLQSRLVTPISIPNLLGVALHHGGADAAVRHAGRTVLVGVVAVASAAVAWRRAWLVPAVGVVLLAAALTLSWVMPWYLAWSLPFAALALPRVLPAATVAACVWLGLGGIPQLPALLHDVHFHPTRSATGLANHDFQMELVR